MINDRITRKDFLKATVLGGAAGLVSSVGCGPHISRRKPTRPNIVFVTIDTQRFDRLGFNGYKEKTGRETSPYLDTLADTGVVFSQNICQSNFTLHSIASLLTSAHVKDVGIHLKSKESEGQTTVAEVLSKNGYRTLGASSTSILGSSKGFDRGFDSYSETGQFKRGGDKTAEELSRMFSQTKKTEPLFIWYHTFDPHSLMDPHDSTLSHFDAPDAFKLRFHTDGDFDDKERKYVGLYGIEKSGRITERQVVELSDQYDGQVRFADWNIEVLMNSLKKRGLFDFERDLFVLTSDHGENLGEHGHCCFHNGLYETITHTPLLMAGAGLPEGKTINALTMNIDVPATIAHVADVKIPKTWKGKNLLGVIRGEQDVVHGVAFSETIFSDAVAVRTGDVRYIHRASPPRREVSRHVEGFSPTGPVDFYGDYPNRFLLSWPDMRKSVSDEEHVITTIDLNGIGKFSHFAFQRSYRDGVCFSSGESKVVENIPDLITCEGRRCSKDITSCLFGEDMWNACAAFATEFEWRVRIFKETGGNQELIFDSNDSGTCRFGPKPSSNFCELYDLKKDPGETENIVKNPEYASVLPELKSFVEEFSAGKTNGDDGPFGKIDAREKEHLKSLGYL